MAVFVAHIANLLMIGNKFEKDGSSYIELKLGDKQLIVIQDPQITIDYKNLASFHGRFVNTTKVIVLDVETNELDDVRDLIYSLCCLFSFIACSQVVFHSQEYPKSTSSWAIVGKTNIYHNVFDIGIGEVVAEFIQTVWDRFIAIKNERRLDIIFDYLHNASYPGSTIESKLVFSFVTLESLKCTYAESKGYPFIKGKYRKSDLKTPYKFIELLEEMFDDIGVVFNNKERIERLRNEIIHSGLSRHDFNYNFEIFVYTQNLIREYLIKLLGYTGYYNKF